VITVAPNLTAAAQPKEPATLYVLDAFDRVRLDFDGKSIECSTKTAIFELLRTGRTLADLLVVDLENRTHPARSRQYVAVVDALFASPLPDPILNAAKGR